MGTPVGTLRGLTDWDVGQGMGHTRDFAFSEFHRGLWGQVEEVVVPLRIPVTESLPPPALPGRILVPHLYGDGLR